MLAGPSHRGISGVGQLEGVQKIPVCDETDCASHAEVAPSAGNSEEEEVVEPPSYPIASYGEAGSEVGC